MILRTAHRRYEFLDVLRGFGALWVLLFHSYGNWIDAGAIAMPPAVHGLIANGWRGVQIFFVVSGYCVTERIVADHQRASGARRFLLDRVLRLLPCYWAALALYCILNLAAMPFNGSSLFGDASHEGALPGSLPQAFFAVGLVEPWMRQTPFLVVSWTLSFELLFYAIAALGLAIANRTGSWVPSFVGGCLLTLLGFVPSAAAWCPVLSLWPQFFIGVLAWGLVNRIPSWRGRLLTATVIFATAGMCSRLFHATPAESLILPAFVGWAVVALHGFDGSISRSTALDRLRQVGLWSYSLYLVHVPLAGKLRNLLGRWLEHREFNYLVPGACAVFGMCGAWLFYRAIEHPSEGARKRMLAQYWPMLPAIPKPSGLRPVRTVATDV